MKKTAFFAILSISLIAFSGLAIAYNANTPDTNTRTFIKSNNGILKAAYGVRHNFDTGFTTDLSPGQIKLLQKLGIETKEVQIYTISARPYCGDGKCHPARENADTCPEDCGIPPEPEPCTPNVQYPYGIEKVNGGTSGDDIIVAVLDTGIDTNHPDLKNNIIDNNCVAFGYSTCEDDNGHGTHVSGTILANGGPESKGIYGVAPKAGLIAIKVLDSKGRGYTDDIAAGMIYAVDNGANIISMSLGGGESSLINNAVTYANNNNVLVVASAGNSGPIEDSIGYPAANPGVVAVAAFDSSNNIADFSSRGINDGDWLIEAREIEFAAPGVYVLSTMNNGCYATMSGTSMAAPHIAGIAARDWQGTATDTRTYLQELAQNYTNNILDYGLSGDDIEAGFGLPITPTIS
ncbi:S8 family serine peptidase [archaeon]|nr:S8 family serine peptidase [archaeon]